MGDAEACEAMAARLHAAFDFDELEVEEKLHGIPDRVVPRPACDSGAGAKTTAREAPAAFLAESSSENGEEEEEQERPACTNFRKLVTRKEVPLDRIFFELEADEDAPRGALYIYAKGLCSDAAAQICGRYLPLRCRSGLGEYDVGVRVHGGLLLTGSRAYPLYVRRGLPRMCSEHSRRSDAVPGPAAIFLAYNSVFQDRWAVLDARVGVWLAETRGFNRNWVVRTPVAQETDIALHAKEFKKPPPVATRAPPSWPRVTITEPKVKLAARVICLPERTASAMAIERQLSDLLRGSTVDVDVQPFEAWDTRGLDPSKLRDAGFVLGPRWKEGAKLLGCAMSHSEIWAGLARDSKTPQPGHVGAVLVLEDDAVLNSARPWELMLPDLLARTDDWDMILLGASCDLNWAAECSQNEPAMWSGDYLARIRFFMGFWGYLITARGAAKCLRCLWGDTKHPQALQGDCDCIVASGCQTGDVKAALCVPNLVLHPLNFQDREWGVRNRCDYVDYEYCVDRESNIGMLGAGGFSARNATQRFRNTNLPFGQIAGLIRRCRAIAATAGPTRAGHLEKLAKLAKAGMSSPTAMDFYVA